MNHIDLVAIAEQIGPMLRQNSMARDYAGQFAVENYALLRKYKIFSAQIPVQLGGGGATHHEMAKFIRQIAHYNPSTSLALAMHQHLIAAAIFNDNKGKPGRKLLERVAADNIILVSTGSNDWMQSNGDAVKCESGYLVTARKPFSSGAPSADLLVTSARFDDPELGQQVIHFSVPLSTKGISLADDWDSLGMRESGSQTITLDKVIVPESAVTLMRPQHGYCTLFDIVLPCALPLIMSVYQGIAEAASSLAIELAKSRKDDEIAPYLIGEMSNNLVNAQIVIADMLSIADDLNFTPSVELSNEILMRKSIATNAVVSTVEKAMEIAGGAGFFRNLGLEKMLRDIYAVHYHPLQEKRQHLFTGRVRLGIPPIT